MASKQIGPELPEGLSTVNTETAPAPVVTTAGQPLVHTPLADGPRVGPKGEYLPSRYKVETVKPDGSTHTVIVVDH